MFVHIVKIAILLLVTVAAMLLMSWGLAWILRRMHVPTRLAAILANVLCFVSFIVWQHVDLKPYGGLEFSIVAFGAIVWGGCLALDLWRIRRKSVSVSA